MRCQTTLKPHMTHMQTWSGTSLAGVPLTECCRSGYSQLQNTLPQHPCRSRQRFATKLWDRLLPQTEITLNLLLQPNATPNVSAYAHFSGPFGYNKMPLAPVGCAVQIHEKADKRGTWKYNSVNDGSSIHHRITTARTHATSKPPRKNNSSIQLISNTKE